MFSATGDGCGAASGASASRTATWTATFGLPLARMKSMRSSRDIWLSDFWTALTLTTPCIVIDIKPSLPSCGSPSLTTAGTKLALCDRSLALSTS
jgi:hypothetical protein